MRTSRLIPIWKMMRIADMRSRDCTGRHIRKELDIKNERTIWKYLKIMEEKSK